MQGPNTCALLPQNFPTIKFKLGEKKIERRGLHAILVPTVIHLRCGNHFLFEVRLQCMHPNLYNRVFSFTVYKAVAEFSWQPNPNPSVV